MFDSVTPARMSKEMANLTTLLIEKKNQKNGLQTIHNPLFATILLKSVKV